MNKIDVWLYGEDKSTEEDGVANFNKKFEKTLGDIEDLIDNGVNCLFIGNNLDSILDTVCDTVVMDIYWLGIVLVIHCLGVFFITFYLYCAGYRFTHAVPRIPG